MRNKGWRNCLQLLSGVQQPFFFCLLSAIIFSTMFPQYSLYAKETGALIESISFSKENSSRETVSFKLNGQYLPKMFALEGNSNTPKLVFDFYDTRHSPTIKGVIKSQGNLITTIRTGMHTDPQLKTRVVLDLVATNDYNFSHDFQVKNNILKITIFHTQKKAPQKNSPKQGKPQTIQPGAEIKTHGGAPAKKGTSSDTVKKEGGTAKPITEKTNKVSPAIVPVLSKSPSVPEVKLVSLPSKPFINDISIEHSPEEGDKIQFRVNNFQPPVVFGMAEQQPSIICDFLDTEIEEKIAEDFSFQGKSISQVRIEKDRTAHKVRVIIELFPNHSYDLKQLFYKEEGLFVLFVNVSDAEKRADKS